MTTGPGARLPVPDVPTLDGFHSDIVAALDGHIDPAVFELCAAELLREQWPHLVPLIGGADDGFDGAFPGEDGSRTQPLIVTTASDPLRNLRRSLKQAIAKGHEPRSAIFATSRLLSPRLRHKLETTAIELGVTLRQIYDRTWFANALYRNPEWCRKLLGLSGTPSPLSKLPVSPRGIDDREMLGRAEELKKVRESSRDVILLGAPGSGKTMLLQRLADDGYFLWEGDREGLANSIRRLAPKLIFVDDAHANVENLQVLAGLRRQLGVSFRIVATIWPPFRDKIRNLLPGAEDVTLSELDANIVADIIRSIAPDLPNPAIRAIVRQAEGRPGLAATLAHLCLGGRYRDVVTGDALYESLGGYAGKDQVLLGCFALAGEVGFPLEVVATFLGRSQDDVHRALSHLAAGGIIRIGNSQRFSVWPKQLRYVLVREVFFGTMGGLAYDLLLEKVSPPSAPLRVLIGAARCGARVPWLQSKLEVVNDDELWHRYAELDAVAAAYVLDKHSELVVDVAQPLLWRIPDRAVPKLLDVVKQARGRRGQEDPAMAALRQWLRASSMDERVLVKRSEEAARQALTWKRRTQGEAAVTLFCIAMSPNWEYAESDPGQGMTLTLRHGVLTEVGLKRLAALWKEVSPELLQGSSLPWKEIFALLREWVHPSVMVPVDATATEMMRETARGMVLDLADSGRLHSGARLRLGEFAAKLEVTLDPKDAGGATDLEVLFPTTNWGGDVDFETSMRAHHARATEWAKSRVNVADIASVVSGILLLQSQVKEADVSVSNCTWVAFQEFARSTTKPIDWIDALVKGRAEPELVWPFVRRVVNDAGDVASLLQHLNEPRYRSLLAEAAVVSGNAHPATVAWSIVNAADYLDGVTGQVRVGNVSDDRVLRLLAHDDVSVRAAMAVAYYIREKNPSGEIGTAWRAAALDTARATDLRGHHEHWLKQMLDQHADLRLEWLKAFLQTQSDDFSMCEIAVDVVRKLPREAREELISRTEFGVSQKDFVSELVDGEPELYEVLLERKELARFHLAPLGPRSRLLDFHTGPVGPRNGWPELSCMALAKGFPEDDVFEALLPRSWGFSGSEVPLWEGWRDAFAKVDAHRDRGVRRMAARGREYMERRIADARERERLTAVRGI